LTLKHKFIRGATQHEPFKLTVSTKDNYKYATMKATIS